jgi:hypothetical protein
MNCVKYSTSEGTLRVEVSIQCLIDQIASQARIPVKEAKYQIKGDAIVIEITPDIEGILNSILNR